MAAQLAQPPEQLAAQRSVPAAAPAAAPPFPAVAAPPAPPGLQAPPGVLLYNHQQKASRSLDGAFPQGAVQEVLRKSSVEEHIFCDAIHFVRVMRNVFLSQFSENVNGDILRKHSET